jgi:hypothetical protein
VEFSSRISDFVNYIYDNIGNITSYIGANVYYYDVQVTNITEFQVRRLTNEKTMQNNTSSKPAIHRDYLSMLWDFIFNRDEHPQHKSTESHSSYNLRRKLSTFGVIVYYEVLIYSSLQQYPSSEVITSITDVVTSVSSDASLLTAINATGAVTVSTNYIDSYLIISHSPFPTSKPSGQPTSVPTSVPTTVPQSVELNVGYVYGVLAFFIFILFFGLGEYLDSNGDKITKSQIKSNGKIELNSDVTDFVSLRVHTPRDDLLHSLKEYIDSIFGHLDGVFSNSSLKLRVCCELFKNHLYLKLLHRPGRAAYPWHKLYNNPARHLNEKGVSLSDTLADEYTPKNRLLVGLHLFAHICIAMLFITLLYSAQYPVFDLPTVCPTLLTKSKCLDYTLDMFDAIDYCSWDDAVSACSNNFNRLDINFKVVCAVVLLSSLIASPLQQLITYLISRLNAPDCVPDSSDIPNSKKLEFVKSWIESIYRNRDSQHQLRCRVVEQLDQHNLEELKRKIVTFNRINASQHVFGFSERYDIHSILKSFKNAESIWRFNSLNGPMMSQSAELSSKTESVVHTITKSEQKCEDDPLIPEFPRDFRDRVMHENEFVFSGIDESIAQVDVILHVNSGISNAIKQVDSIVASKYTTKKKDSSNCMTATSFPADQVAKSPKRINPRNKSASTDVTVKECQQESKIQASSKSEGENDVDSYSSRKHFDRLVADISAYRAEIKDVNVLREFDTAWGITAVTTPSFPGDDTAIGQIEFTPKSNYMCPSFWRCKSNKVGSYGVTEVEYHIERAHYDSLESAEKLRKLQNDYLIGYNIMRLFAAELLYHNGHRVESEFLKSSIRNEYSSYTAATRSEKILAFCIITVMIVLSIFACVYVSSDQNIYWTFGWIVYCIIYVFVDCFFVEMASTLVIHMIIPNFAYPSIKLVKYVLYTMVDKFVSGLSCSELSFVGNVNAQELLFQSNHLAKVFPHLFESRLILWYKTCSPRFRASYLEGLRDLVEANVSVFGPTVTRFIVRCGSSLSPLALKVAFTEVYAAVILVVCYELYVLFPTLYIFALFMNIVVLFGSLVLLVYPTLILSTSKFVKRLKKAASVKLPSFKVVPESKEEKELELESAAEVACSVDDEHPDIAYNEKLLLLIAYLYYLNQDEVDPESFDDGIYKSGVESKFSENDLASEIYASCINKNVDDALASAEMKILDQMQEARLDFYNKFTSTTLEAGVQNVLSKRAAEAISAQNEVQKLASTLKRSSIIEEIVLEKNLLDAKLESKSKLQHRLTARNEAQNILTKAMVAESQLATKIRSEELESKEKNTNRLEKRKIRKRQIRGTWKASISKTKGALHAFMPKKLATNVMVDNSSSDESVKNNEVRDTESVTQDELVVSNQDPPKEKASRWKTSFRKAAGVLRLSKLSTINIEEMKESSTNESNKVPTKSGALSSMFGKAAAVSNAKSRFKKLLDLGKSNSVSTSPSDAVSSVTDDAHEVKSQLKSSSKVSKAMDALRASIRGVKMFTGVKAYSKESNSNLGANNAANSSDNFNHSEAIRATERVIQQQQAQIESLKRMLEKLSAEQREHVDDADGTADNPALLQEIDNIQNQLQTVTSEYAFNKEKVLKIKKAARNRSEKPGTSFSSVEDDDDGAKPKEQFVMKRKGRGNTVVGVKSGKGSVNDEKSKLSTTTMAQSRVFDVEIDSSDDSYGDDDDDDEQIRVTKQVSPMPNFNSKNILTSASRKGANTSQRRESRILANAHKVSNFHSYQDQYELNDDDDDDNEIASPSVSVKNKNPMSVNNSNSVEKEPRSDVLTAKHATSQKADNNLAKNTARRSSLLVNTSRAPNLHIHEEYSHNLMSVISEKSEKGDVFDVSSSDEDI